MTAEMIICDAAQPTVMDKRRIHISVRVAALRAKTWGRTGLRLIAIVALAVAAANLLATNIGHDGLWITYRQVWDVRVVDDAGVVHLADVVVMAAGAAVAWAV